MVTVLCIFHYYDCWVGALHYPHHTTNKEIATKRAGWQTKKVEKHISRLHSNITSVSLYNDQLIHAQEPIFQTILFVLMNLCHHFPDWHVEADRIMTPHPPRPPLKVHTFYDYSSILPHPSPVHMKYVPLHLPGLATPIIQDPSGNSQKLFKITVELRSPRGSKICSISLRGKFQYNVLHVILQNIRPL